MTEYDYSPAAYERFMATQDRISKWTHQTSKAKLSNPFVPTDVDPAERSDFYSSGSGSGSGSGSKNSPSGSSSSSGTTLKRSNTAPSRSHHSSTSTSNSRSSTTRSSSSTIRPPSSTRTSSTARPRPHASRSRTLDVSSTSSRPARASPLRSHTMPTSYTSGDGIRHTILPKAKPGSMYIILPKGQNVAVISPTSSSKVTHLHSSPTKKSQPLLKRLLSGLSTKGSDTSSASVRSGRTGAWSGGKPRRSRTNSF